MWTVIIVMINDIKRAIMIIDFMLEPLQMIMIGPKATLGRLLITVKYGSRTLDKNLFHHSIIAIIIPRTVAKVKLIRVS